MVVLATIPLTHASEQGKVMPIPGRVTFIRLSSPRQPDRVESVNLASGEIERLVEASPERPSIRSFCFSPDRKQFLFEMGSGLNWYENNEIYRRNSQGGSVQRVTENGIYDGDPAWSLDGARFAFTRGYGVEGHVYVRELESGKERRLSTPGLVVSRDPHWLTEATLLLHGFDTEKRHCLVDVNIATGDVRWLLKDQVDYLSL